MRVLLGSLSVTLGSLREGMGGAETEGQGAESALDAWEPLSALLFGCLESGRVVLRCAGLCWAGPGRAGRPRLRRGLDIPPSQHTLACSPFDNLISEIPGLPGKRSALWPQLSLCASVPHRERGAQPAALGKGEGEAG